MNIESIPNLFIVGFSKTGTTALVEYLKQHQSIFVPWRKEPHTLYNKRFPLWATKGSIEDHIMDYNSYLRLYSNAKDYRYRVDGSTSYTFDTDIASKIREFNPYAKIVICIRDQKERLVSSYLFTYPSHREGNFRRWIERYLIPDIDTFLMYDKIRAYHTIFGKHLKIVENSMLKNKPQDVLDSIFRFLDLEPIKVRVTYRNPSIVSPTDGMMYRYGMFILYAIIVECLNLSRSVGIEEMGRKAINGLRYNMGKKFITKKAKSVRHDNFLDMIPEEIVKILDNDYNQSLELARNSNILSAVDSYT